MAVYKTQLYTDVLLQLKGTWMFYTWSRRRCPPEASSLCIHFCVFIFFFRRTIHFKHLSQPTNLTAVSCPISKLYKYSLRPSKRMIFKSFSCSRKLWFYIYQSIKIVLKSSQRLQQSFGGRMCPYCGGTRSLPDPDVSWPLCDHPPLMCTALLSVTSPVSLPFFLSVSLMLECSPFKDYIKE